jgi:hypothetical protein
MDIGKPQKVRTNVPGARPIVVPKPKPASRPISVPNWPVKKPVSVPVRKSG